MDTLRPYILELLSLTIILTPIAALWCLIGAAKEIKVEFKESNK